MFWGARCGKSARRVLIGADSTRQRGYLLPTEKESAYQLCCRDLSKVLDERKVLQEKKTELEEQRNILQKALSALQNALRNNEKQLIDIQKQYELYQKAPETHLVAGTVEELKERLPVLKLIFKKTPPPTFDV